MPGTRNTISTQSVRPTSLSVIAAKANTYRKSGQRSTDAVLGARTYANVGAANEARRTSTTRKVFVAVADVFAFQKPDGTFATLNELEIKLRA